MHLYEHFVFKETTFISFVSSKVAIFFSYKHQNQTLSFTSAMATPLAYLLMANSNPKQEPTTRTTHIQSAPPKLESSLSNRGRKPNKGQPRKKVPQRGMGVAQLERLRLQETLKNNMQEANKLESSNPQPSQLSVPDPIPSFPVLYSVNSGTVQSVINGGGCSSCDHQCLVVKRIENGTSHLGQFVVNPYVLGPPDVKVLVGNNAASVFENSKELSSIPKVMQQYNTSPTPDFFFKQKKRFNEESNGRRDKTFPEITPLNVSDLLRSNLENSIDLNDLPNGFGARAARSAFYANHHNFSEGAEVLAIRRKGNPDGGSVFMEYNFFPGKSSRSSSGKSTSTCFNEVEFPTAEGSVAVVGSGEASCLTTSDYSGYNNYSASIAAAAASSSSSSNSVDLSLKLSY